MYHSFSIEDLTVHHVNDSCIPVQDLIREYDSDPMMWSTYASIVYCIPLLLHVDLYSADKDTIYRMICRCVEHNLWIQLRYILSHDIDCDRNLLLRRVGSPEIYSFIQQYGYKDIELDKRIVWLQRRFRSDRQPIYHRYEGPNIVDYYRDDKYYGYRRAIHRMRWDKKNRDTFYQELVQIGAIGNCEWEAFMDYIHLSNERSIQVIR